jgi:PAS domain S-box-containing protein
MRERAKADYGCRWRLWNKYRCLMVVLLIALLFSPLKTFAVDAPHDAIVVQLKSEHRFQFAGFYAAVDEGYYADSGLNVHLRAASRQTNPVEEVLSGRADYAIGDADLIRHWQNGRPVTALAVFMQHSPLAIFSLARSNIANPTDLIGRRVAYSSSTNVASARSMLLRAGVAAEHVQKIATQEPIQQLMNGRVDAVVASVSDQVYDLQRRGSRFSVMKPREYGVDFYGDTLFTHTSRLEARSEEVAKFRAATIRGWEYALANPHKIIQSIMQRYPEGRTQSQLEYEAEKIAELMRLPLGGIGYMHSERWQHIADAFSGLGLTQPVTDVSAFIYDADTSDRQVADALFVWLGLAVAATILLSYVLFLLKGRYKKVAVSHQHQLSSANSRLLEQTEQLMKTQGALKSLNQQLVSSISERTIELQDAHEEIQRHNEYRKERELSLRLLSQALESSGSGVIITSEMGIVQYINSGLLALTGYEKTVLLGKSLDILERSNKDPYFSLGWEESKHTQPSVNEEAKCICADGSFIWVQISLSRIAADDGLGSHYVFVCEDISRLKQSRDEMEKLAFYDALTGLENRSLFRLRLEKTLARIERTNEFAALSSRIKPLIRRNDCFARLSGDEFTVLLMDIARPDDISQVAESILETIAAPINIAGNECHIGASIGITTIPEDGHNAEQLMKNADLAMYRAKNSGRNQFQFYSEEMNRELNHHHRLIEEMRHGLTNGEFFMLYQPQLSACDQHHLVGLEALVRWGHPERGLLEPVEFIRFAEESGLMLELGRKIYDDVFSMLKRYGKQLDRNIKLSINISERQLLAPDFVTAIGDSINRHRVDPGRIQLEVNEAAFYDYDNRKPIFDSLGRLGFGLSVDAFGTGRSSLRDLSDLAIDRVKIDRSFIYNISKDYGGAEVAEAAIAMAHKLNIKVFAEGVETSSQLAFLKERQCDAVQGYYFDRPMSINSVVEKYLH